MAAPETPSESRSARRVAVTTVNLPGGDTIQFSFTGDIVDQLKAYEATLPGESQPAPHVESAKPAPKNGAKVTAPAEAGA